MTQWTYYGNVTPGARRLVCRCGTPWQGTSAEASTCTVCYSFVNLPT